MYQDFSDRAHHIPFFGLGLSVDVHSPDIFELCEELQTRRIPIAYLELFHADPKTLEIVRDRLPHLPLVYHVEGLWLTQPDWETRYAFQQRLEAAARDLQILQSPWINQECATKEIGGFTFGTYLPPIFCASSAEMTAHHARRAQQTLDQYNREGQTEPPLLLLEVPPLTYFSIGDMPYAEFFSRIVTLAPCGLVLDLGHVWTVYRYTEAWKRMGLETFFADFLKKFPLERVIQIHLAGLASHPHLSQPISSGHSKTPPFWIDAHEASIPQELFTLLNLVLQNPRLINLKGVALEVDSKPIPVTCREIPIVQESLNTFYHSPNGIHVTVREGQAQEDSSIGCKCFSKRMEQKLIGEYRQYVELVSGKESGRFAGTQEWDGPVGEGLEYYVSHYLPYEIIFWGGEVEMMFPQTCQLLGKHDISLNRFFDFWFSHARESPAVYDFFFHKVHLFVEFLGVVLPSANSLVKQEAELLCQSYVMASQMPSDTLATRQGSSWV